MATPLRNVSSTPVAHVSARPGVTALGASKIREVANAGIGRADVLPFWFGEPDEVTPQFIRDRARDALAAGETFYSSNFGIAPLREAISTYVTSLHGTVEPDRIAVTSSGVSALMIAAQALFSPGDRVVIITPVWPKPDRGPPHSWCRGGARASHRGERALDPRCRSAAFSADSERARTGHQFTQ